MPYSEFLSCCLLKLFLAVAVPQTSLFLITLTFWGVLGRYCVECPAIAICPIFFSWLDWGPIISYRATNVTWHYWYSSWSPGVVIEVSHVKLLFSSCPPWKEVTMWDPLLRSGGQAALCSTFLRGENLHKLFGILHRRLVPSLPPDLHYSLSQSNIYPILWVQIQ